MIPMRIKELRKAHGYTQADVADYIGFSRSAYTNMEIGIREMTVETLLKLAVLYNVSTDYILEHEKEPTIADGGQHLSSEDQQLLRLYHLASPDDQAVVDTVLRKYRSPSVSQKAI